MEGLSLTVHPDRDTLISQNYLILVLFPDHNKYNHILLEQPKKSYLRNT